MLLPAVITCTPKPAASPPLSIIQLQYFIKTLSMLYSGRFCQVDVRVSTGCSNLHSPQGYTYYPHLHQPSRLSDISFHAAPKGKKVLSILIISLFTIEVFVFFSFWKYLNQIHNQRRFPYGWVLRGFEQTWVGNQAPPLSSPWTGQGLSTVWSSACESIKWRQ